MAKVRAAAVYARISSDQDGTALGVKRQLKDCRKLATDLGWPVAEEYVDNDLSAYSGKRRPGYEQMLADIAEGSRDAVIVYHADRLTRRPIELEQFLETITTAGLRHVRFVAGADVDVANGDGLMVLRLLSAVAANESASKSRRVRRKMDELAAAGLPHGGVRAFGYEDDKLTVRPAEAEIVRAVVARYLAGESTRSLATWLDGQSVKTVAGGPWTTTTLRAMLRSPRIAGLREHRGEVVGPAVWPAIITVEERDRVLARMATKATSGRRAPRRYLLSGLARCGKCGKTLYSSARRERSGKETRRYVCLSGPDHGGCGGTMVVAGPLEDLITDAVLYRLDTPELADALAGRAAVDEEAAVLSEGISADRAQLDELAALYADRQIGAREWLAARNPIEERVRAAEKRLGRMTQSESLTGLVGNAEALRGQWADLSLSRQHAIIIAVLDHVVIGPGTPGVQAFDRDRADPVWRL
jgi:DNA invertase Pin-like site-specific DNA recombinase